ncbi:STAS domain-containing protein [Xinfangfangia sp. D13-10-4-6]|nr:STAS domain-containing protein [Pseudogemmobacter hezensis]
MQIEEHDLAGVLVVAPSGRLDSNSAPVLDAALSGPAKARDRLVVDLTGVDYVSSAGLRILLKTAKLARASGQRLALAGLTASVREVFDVSGFTKLFTIAETAGAAAESL